MIYEFDVEQNLLILDNTYLHVKNVRDSVADNRKYYRDFAKSICLDYDSLESCCNSFDTNLLIASYTFSEQLFKNFYYHLIEKDHHNNQYLLKFINEKINPEKFSPNVMFNNIESSIQKDLFKEFKLVLSKNSMEVKYYDSMVKARHEYAHSGTYNYPYTYFETSIRTIKYLVWEFKTLIEYGRDYRAEFQSNLKTISDKLLQINKLMSSFEENGNAKIKGKLRDCFRDLREQLNYFIKKFGSNFASCTIFVDLQEKMEEYVSLDFRSFDSVKGLYFDLYKEFSSVIN